MAAAPVPAQTSRRQPSLRRRLLLFLLIPTLALMVLDTVFVYLVALRYSNRIHDRDLAISTVGLAEALQAGHSDGHLSQESRQLLEYNPDGRSFFSVRSLRHGLISGTGTRIAKSHAPGAPVLLFVGHEFGPKADPIEGLRAAYRTCDVE